jgi:hypothetical protein
LAKAIIPLEAKCAMKARHQRNNGNRISFAHLLNSGPDGTHCPTDLMAQHNWILLPGLAAKSLDIGAAYPTGRY